MVRENIGVRKTVFFFYCLSMILDPACCHYLKPVQNDAQIRVGKDFYLAKYEPGLR